MKGLRAKKDECALLESLRSVYFKLGRRPTMKEIGRLCDGCYGVYAKRFGGIEGACLAAGLPDYRTELALQLRRVNLELGHMPNTIEFRRVRHDLSTFTYDVVTYIQEFGGWKAATAASQDAPEELIVRELHISA